MKIKILGAGWYGCHLSLALGRLGHDIEIHDIADQIFAGASGGIPARLHLGFHYPRSRVTRAACQEHVAAFMAQYGGLTRGVPINIYAIAETESFVDYDQYVETLRNEVQFVEIDEPYEFGLYSVEGAVLTGERHILSEHARKFFAIEFAKMPNVWMHFGCAPHTDIEDPEFDWIIDCTFAAESAAGVDRYEPCIVPLLFGPTDRAITIMDGPFHSLYPWDEGLRLCSLSSAALSPLSKECRTYAEAKAMLDNLDETEERRRAYEMIEAMSEFYPAIDHDFELHEVRRSIRAMPASGADTRLVDVRREGERGIRVRAGKIDAVIHAEREVLEIMG